MVLSSPMSNEDSKAAASDSSTPSVFRGYPLHHRLMWGYDVDTKTIIEATSNVVSRTNLARLSLTVPCLFAVQKRSYLQRRALVVPQTPKILSNFAGTLSTWNSSPAAKSSSEFEPLAASLGEAGDRKGAASPVASSPARAMSPPLSSASSSNSSSSSSSLSGPPAYRSLDFSANSVPPLASNPSFVPLAQSHPTTPAGSAGAGGVSLGIAAQQQAHVDKKPRSGPGSS